MGRRCGACGGRPADLSSAVTPSAAHRVGDAGETCIGLGRRPFSYSRRFGQEGGARTRYTLTGVGATSSRSCSALSVAASAGRPGTANVPSEFSAEQRKQFTTRSSVARTRSGQTAGKIVSASQGNREQLRSPESAVCASDAPGSAGCGPGGGFESRRSPSSSLQISIFGGEVDRAQGKRGEIRA